MKYVEIGESRLEVSRIAFGGWAIIGGLNWGAQDESDSISAIQAAFDAGVTLFDTAEGYGDGASERMLAKSLGNHRSEVVYASKVSPANLAPVNLRAACERSLTALQTDVIDLYQIHFYNLDISLGPTLNELRRLQTEGKIREIGVSNFGLRQLQEAIDSGVKIATNQLSYSLLFRAIEFEILPKCLENGIGVLCYSPLMQGLLTGKFASPDELADDRRRSRHFNSANSKTSRHGEAGAEAETFATIEAVRQMAQNMDIPMDHAALAWLLAQPGVVAPIVGARNPAQAVRNAQAIEVELAAAQIELLSTASDALKHALGPNADMWAPPSATRIH